MCDRAFRRACFLKCAVATRSEELAVGKGVSEVRRVRPGDRCDPRRHLRAEGAMNVLRLWQAGSEMIWQWQEEALLRFGLHKASCLIAAAGINSLVRSSPGGTGGPCYGSGRWYVDIIPADDRPVHRGNFHRDLCHALLAACIEANRKMKATT